LVCRGPGFRIPEPTPGKDPIIRRINNTLKQDFNGDIHPPGAVIFLIFFRYINHIMLYTMGASLTRITQRIANKGFGKYPMHFKFNIASRSIIFIGKGKNNNLYNRFK
jgi:hypothetical protein